MNKRVVIFGLKDFAELAHYYLVNDSAYDVVAFCVNEAYLPNEKSFRGLPIISFEEVENHYPPNDFQLFAPMAPKRMNTLRQNVYEERKSKGYSFVSCVSSKAIVFDNPIGENCFILENNVIQPFTSIGNNVVMWSGNHIGNHSVIKNHVLFTSHVVLSGNCVVEPNCFFGVNATVRDGITLAEGTLVAMAASIIKSTEAWSIYIGNPAKKLDSKNSLEAAL